MITQKEIENELGANKMKEDLNAPSYRIALAGDYRGLRRDLNEMVSEMQDVVVVAEVSSGLDLIGLLDECFPHMVIFASYMADLEGIETIRKIKVVSPRVKILVLSLARDKESLYHALSAGVEGYLLKGDGPAKISDAIETIRQGGTYLSPAFLEELSSHWVQTCRQDWNPSSKLLTAREKEILKLIAAGMSSKEIAGNLFISIRTVEHHRDNMMNKLNLKNIAGLIRYAVCHGYLT